MNAYRTHAVVGENGKIVLDKLPLAAGQQVEVLVLSPNLRGLGSASGLAALLMEAPSFSDEELARVEEAHQWLANWKIPS